MSEKHTVEKSDKVEMVFIDKNGRYTASYEDGDLVGIYMASSSDVPEELVFTFENTINNPNSLGYNDTNRMNTFTFVLPSDDDPVTRFEFIKGDSYEC